MSLQDDVERVLGRSVTIGPRVHGGDIGQSFQARTAEGGLVFVKAAPGAPTGLFAAEAAGLRALAAVRDGCRVPGVLGVSEEVLVLEWVERGPGERDTSEQLGRGLAAMHRVTREVCGFDAGDGFIGATPQPNPDVADMVAFFRDQRLGFQQALLRSRGRYSPRLDRGLERLRDALEDRLRVPGERPALLHGDLWGGNWMPDGNGRPILFDPAAHFGCREADLAMTELFGGFDDRFYAAYDEAFRRAPGYEERRDVYNLYHLLNHANLFGGGWVARAEEAVLRLV